MLHSTVGWSMFWKTGMLSLSRGLRPLGLPPLLDLLRDNHSSASGCASGAGRSRRVGRHGVAADVLGWASCC